ncbi:MAG: helix-turn-helix domain-containing protein [Natronosporangium sp.]
MPDPTGLDPGDRAQRGRHPRPLLRTMLGAVLRRTRLAQGRTLAEVARAARVSMPYLSELERGRKEASSEVLAATCAALGIELADLLAEIRRDLVELAGQPGTVVRLDAFRARRAGAGRTPGPVPRPGPGDVQARLAA